MICFYYHEEKSFYLHLPSLLHAGQIKTVVESMINIVGTIFVAVGVILTVYSVGQLVLAFKNEDADSKSRASTMLVVGICLIALPSIVSSLKLTENIK